jgi:hypothetical protein
MKTSVTWYIKPCSLLKVSRYFRGTNHLHLQGSKQAHHEINLTWVGSFDWLILRT